MAHIREKTVNAIAYEQSFKGYTIKYKVGEKVIVTEDLDNTENRFTVSDHYRIGWTCFFVDILCDRNTDYR